MAWVLAQGEDIIPIPGTKHQKYLIENAGAVDIELTFYNLKDIDTVLQRHPDIGERYSDNSNKLVDKN